MYSSLTVKPLSSGLNHYLQKINHSLPRNFIFDVRFYSLTIFGCGQFTVLFKLLGLKVSFKFFTC